MNLDAFGLLDAGPLLLPPLRGGTFLGPWPRLDRHGNIYGWQCLEPRCLFRTQPEARGGGAWWPQKVEHAAAHPDRDPHTTGHPTSLRGVHIGASPESYLRGEGWVTSPEELAAEDAE